MLNTLCGNKATVQSLQAALATGHLSHAVLITGQAGCGSGYAARCLAADYLFPQGGSGATAVMQNTSSEVLLVQGEGKSGNIPVERIREIRSNIHHSSLSAAGRVVWVRDAHRMAPPAYNALLKVLEEPPADALFILTSYSTANIPETIRSRCTQYALAPVQPEECAAFLAQHQTNKCPHTPEMLATVYGGRIGLGLAVLQNETRCTLLSEALALATALSAKNYYQILAILAKYEGRAEGEREKREHLLADFGDVLAASLHSLPTLGLPVFSSWQVASFLPPIMKASVDLLRNASPKTVFTALAIELARADI